MIRIAPSVLACDFSKLGREIREIDAAGADMIHLDVMDGIFVPNISFGFPVLESVRGETALPFDVHLMITAPERYLERFLDAGADSITFHCEACEDIPAALDIVRRRGKKVALSVKPKTPVEAVYPYLERCDMILVMTVEPGYGGQKLIPETVEKIRALRAEIDRRSLSTLIQADGGINEATAPAVIAAGADILVAGSAVFRAEDRRAAMDALRIRA